MKKLFWLIKKEIKSVYKLLILITIIITLFLSALNGVVNILIDYSKNFENSLNEDLKGLSFSVNETDFDSFKKYCDDAVVFATLKNFTSSATLTCSNGNIFETEQSKQKEMLLFYIHLMGKSFIIHINLKTCMKSLILVCKVDGMKMLTKLCLALL